MPISPKEFLENLRKSRLIESDRIRQLLSSPGAEASLHSAEALCGYLIQCEQLTSWQGRMLLKGVRNGFFVGKHKLLGRIGCGGMSVVYLAQHVALERLVAIKVLDGRRAQHSGGLERFLRESKATASLDHPNVVRVHDFDSLETHHYLVMEYVDGPSLHELVDEIGPLPVRAAVHYLMQAASGLAAAHDNRLVHRDVKPANLLVSSQGVVKVTDLGLARNEQSEAARLTIDDGGMLGTVDYISPEQALDSHHVTSAADIYSLGASFYFLLTGSPPFPGGTVSSKLIRHQMSPPHSIVQFRQDVPARIESLCFQMMAKEASERPTALQVQAELAAWLATQSGIDLLVAGMLQPASLRSLSDMTPGVAEGLQKSGSPSVDGMSQAEGSTLDLLDPATKARRMIQEAAQDETSSVSVDFGEFLVAPNSTER